MHKEGYTFVVPIGNDLERQITWWY